MIIALIIFAAVFIHRSNGVVNFPNATTPQQQPTKTVPKPFSFTTLIDGATLTTVKVFSKNGFRKEVRNGQTVLVMDLPDDLTQAPSVPAQKFEIYIAVAEAQNGEHGWFKVTKTPDMKYSFECQTQAICGLSLHSMYILGSTQSKVPVNTPVGDRLKLLAEEIPMAVGIASMASFQDLVKAYPIVGIKNIISMLELSPGDRKGPMVTDNFGAIAVTKSSPTNYFYAGYDIGKSLDFWNSFSGFLVSDNIFCDLRASSDLPDMSILLTAPVNTAIYSNAIFQNQKFGVPFDVQIFGAS